MTVSDTLCLDAFTQIDPRLDRHPAGASRLEELLVEMRPCTRYSDEPRIVAGAATRRP